MSLQFIDSINITPLLNSAVNIWSENLGNRIFVVNNGLPGITAIQFSSGGDLFYISEKVVGTTSNYGIGGDNFFQYLSNPASAIANRNIYSFKTSRLGVISTEDTQNDSYPPRIIWADYLGHIFVSSYNGIKIYNISSTSQISLHSTLFAGTSMDVFGCENYVFAALSSNGIRIYTWQEVQSSSSSSSASSSSSSTSSIVSSSSSSSMSSSSSSMSSSSSSSASSASSSSSSSNSSLSSSSLSSVSSSRSSSSSSISSISSSSSSGIYPTEIYEAILSDSKATPKNADFIWGNADWVCVGSQSGHIYVYENMDGVLNYKSDTVTPAGVMQSLKGSGSNLYATFGTQGLYWYTINDDGTLSLEETQVVGGVNFGRISISSGFLFVINYQKGIRSYKISAAPASIFFGPMMGPFGKSFK